MNLANSSHTYSFKVVLLGEGCVGKTSLVLRYIENKFHEKHLSTLQASFWNKKLNIGDKCANLAIWDTAGQERFHALGPIYYRDSNGAVLVYDITDQDSFEKVKKWVKELRKVLGDDVCLCIAGNKTDLEKSCAVPASEAKTYAASVQAQHFLTSAKQNRGIEELFMELTKRMIDSADNSNEPSSKKKSNQMRNVVLVDNEEPQPTHSSCCSR